MVIKPVELIEDNIREAIRSLIDDARERIIKEATFQFERELRRAAGSVAINVADYFSIERCGSDLVIKVQVEKK